MRILSSNSAVKMVNTYKNSSARSGSESKHCLSKDRIEISSQARDMQIAFQGLNCVSDIREEKVSAIIDKIQTGNYEINSSVIAKKMMGL